MRVCVCLCVSVYVCVKQENYFQWYMGGEESSGKACNKIIDRATRIVSVMSQWQRLFFGITAWSANTD